MKRSSPEHPQNACDLTERLAAAEQRLDQAGSDIRGLDAKADAVARLLEQLDAEAVDPLTVRRATLNRVRDRLLDAGDLTGARLVMRMACDTDEWSRYDA